MKRVDQLAEFLKASTHSIRVEGHTDDRERVARPIRGRWELSLARANQVLERLVVKGVSEERLSLAGYGPSRPRFKNLTRKARAGNRRVEIVIINPKRAR